MWYRMHVFLVYARTKIKVINQSVCHYEKAAATDLFQFNQN